MKAIPKASPKVKAIRKAQRKARLVLSGAVVVLIAGANVVGLTPPAFTPTPAEALQAIQVEQAKTLTTYANADYLTDTQLVELLSAVGFTGKDLAEAWAIAKKESRGNPLSHNGNRKTGDNSYGLFQVNMLGTMGADRRAKFNLSSNAELLNPVVNAKVAYHMSNGGKDWSSWKGTKNSVFKSWLSKFPSKSKAVAKATATAKAIALAKAKQ